MAETADDLPPVIGHRGAAGHAPENTLASLRCAAALGVRWVEFDTKLSADGEVIVFHDDRLERTTNGAGKVADALLSELKGLDAGGWFDPAFAGEPIPTLREAMETLAEFGLGANVEVKASPGREVETGARVARLLKQEWPAGLPPPLISSFKPDALAAARETAPEIPRSLLFFDLPWNWRRRVERLECRAVHVLHTRFARRLAAWVIGAGYALRCFTVNDRARADTLYDWGVASLISDVPDRLLPVAEPEPPVR